MTSPEQVRSTRFLRAARWWARRELGRTLDGLTVLGLDTAREACRRGPVVFAATHVAFWDPFVLVVLDEELGTEGYAVMDAVNLCRVPFFLRLGAIPVQRGSPRAGLRLAASVLNRAGRAVWIFPQGGHRPPHLRPLRFLPGIRLLARLAPDAAIVPVGLQYAFAESQGPVAYAAFGEPIPPGEIGGEAGVERLEHAVEAQLERIDRLLAGEPEPSTALIPSRNWQEETGVGTRLLGWWLRPRVPGHGEGG